MQIYLHKQSTRRSKYSAVGWHRPIGPRPDVAGLSNSRPLFIQIYLHEVDYTDIFSIGRHIRPKPDVAGLSDSRPLFIQIYIYISLHQVDYTDM